MYRYQVNSHIGSKMLLLFCTLHVYLYPLQKIHPKTPLFALSQIVHYLLKQCLKVTCLFPAKMRAESGVKTEKWIQLKAMSWNEDSFPSTLLKVVCKCFCVSVGKRIDGKQFFTGTTFLVYGSDETTHNFIQL